MDGQLLPVLLLLLGASGLWGRGPGPEGTLEEPPEEEPPEEEPPEEDGILVLSRQTLGLALREHPALLVEFCECLGPVGLGDPPAGATWGVLPPHARATRPHRAPGAPSEDTRGTALGLSWAWGPSLTVVKGTGAGETHGHCPSTNSSVKG
eukprot:bmy_01864T0